MTHTIKDLSFKFLHDHLIASLVKITQPRPFANGIHSVSGIPGSNQSAYISPDITKRVGGIEPPSLAWKAKVLPLNYTRNQWLLTSYVRVAQFSPGMSAAFQINWGQSPPRQSPGQWQHFEYRCGLG
jgi:hypothetical protein